MLTAQDIRRQFLEFFRSKGHLIVPSAPIVVKNDPTLLFINSGMAPFKDAFLGNQPAPAPRVADTQKCLRVSGKHNDLEEVGVDTYHHTMFEMLGNWSFGDYFKKEAIAWSWELLTDVYGIPKEQLYVTVFGGDEKEGLPMDSEAFEYWKQHIDASRILMGSKKDNFWEMGDTGPCGPCTEIHVDCRTAEERADGRGGALVNADHPQVIEIWNNVFMQFNRLKDGSLQPLPAQHVDTGMGFERLVRVLQGKQSNYDTDVFTGTIAKTEEITGRTYDCSDSREAIAFRVLADHIRAIAFTISDGQLPASTGAGYVIRRILRRAVRYYFTYLGYKQPLLHQLLPVLAAQFAEVFPELDQQKEFVKKVIQEEEEAFLRTLDRGLMLIDKIIRLVTIDGEIVEEQGLMDDIDKIKSIGFQGENKIELSGKVAFTLYDRYGFPFDLTRLIAQENGIEVDEPGFNAEMKQQKDRSRAATALDAGDWIVLEEGGATRFTGYDSLEEKTRVLRYRKVKAKGKESYQIVLQTTPFYAESGGQVGDRGTFRMGEAEFRIEDTKKENDLIIHFAPSIPDDLRGEVVATVDKDIRKKTELHHSATHLLHAALKQVLGHHVAQKGSLNNEDYLRFDFSHFAKMTDEEIGEVEAIVNRKIREDVPVVIREMSKDEAIALGATALFGEKYGEVVRVVTMDPGYSIELCGGTHVGRTGELGFFKVKSEGAVAAGVRRIEALSGAAAEDFVNAQLKQLEAIRTMIKNPKEPAKAIDALQTELGALRKKIEAAEARQLAGMVPQLIAAATRNSGLDIVGAVVEVSSVDSLKKLALDVAKGQGSGEAAAVLGAVVDGKAALALAFTDALAAGRKADAGKLVKDVAAALVKGGGGGSKTLASAVGTDTGRLEEAVEAVKGAVAAL